jgi:hypothetical protein
MRVALYGLHEIVVRLGAYPARSNETCDYNLGVHSETIYSYNTFLRNGAQCIGTFADSSVGPDRACSKATLPNSTRQCRNR